MFVTETVRAILADPRSHSSLAIGHEVDTQFRPIKRSGFDAPVIGVTKTLLVSGDQERAFPIVDGYPVLMWPDALMPGDSGETVDLQDRRYWEAYSEMEFYNPFALNNAKNLRSTSSFKFLDRLRSSKPSPQDFPEPREQWLEGGYEIEAKVQAFRYLAPVEHKIFVQLGGEGREAVRFLLAGAKEAIHVTPMIGEAVYGRALAEAFGVQDRLSSIIAIGEELPFRAGSIDILFSSFCMHHMQLELALPEIRRVLTPGGKFAATDPWKAPLYKLGTSIFGQREQGLFDRSQSVFCKPIDQHRLTALAETFQDHVVSNHAPLLRYPLLALKKFGIAPPERMLFPINRFDDWLGRKLKLGTKWGSSLMFGGTKGPSTEPIS